MKKLLTFFVALAAFILINTDVEASTLGAETIDGRFLSSEELTQIRDLNPESTILLSEEQAIERAAEVKGVSVEEILKERGSNVVGSGITPRATTCGWLETNTRITTKKASYKPNLIVIVESCYGGGGKWINVNKEPYLMEFEAEDVYAYVGTIKVDLKSGHFIYTINGKFMSSGTSVHSGTVGLTTPIFTATYTYSGSSSQVHANVSQVRIKRDVLGY